MMTSRCVRNSQPTPRRGMVLLSVLVVLVLLSLAAYHYSDLMTAEYAASDNFHQAAQARSFADSGIHYAAALLSDPDSVEAVLNRNPFDNPGVFRDIPVPVDEKRGLLGSFTLVAPASDGGDPRFGVVDEGGKINLNAWMKADPTGDTLLEMLKKLPNMGEETAASIVDWLDADTTPHQGGAESDYYSGLSPSYRAKNGPIDSLEELLMVKGVTPDLLFGADLNRNGVRDENESDGELGWAAYLTLYSREMNANAKGEMLINLNDAEDLAILYEQMYAPLGEELAKFVLLYRQYGPSTPTGQRQSLGLSIFSLFSGGKMPQQSKQQVVQGNLGDYEPDFKRIPFKTIRSIFDLVDTQVTIRSRDKNKPSVMYTSPLNDPAKRRELLPKLFENATIFTENELPSRINVNTASREVLSTLEELTVADVDNILSLRPKYTSSETPDPIFQTPAWLATEAKIKTDTLKKIEKMVTTRSQVYRVQALGYFLDNKGPSARVEAVIDTNGGRPRILAWRDLSELGRWLNLNR